MEKHILPVLAASISFTMNSADILVQTHGYVLLRIDRLDCCMHITSFPNFAAQAGPFHTLLQDNQFWGWRRHCLSGGIQTSEQDHVELAIGSEPQRVTQVLTGPGICATQAFRCLWYTEPSLPIGRSRGSSFSVPDIFHYTVNRVLEISWS
ncbi:hypothetical protein BDP27DRAFT_763156 [Rhodocollybia butyracea]|uniref:Uncharacterized protein n=1 Tax=Rhodocollybia butyracea TaxID=206335 RepID=A0A9P5PUQ5_9AGAR|nr:hypothetical protein BDP27DRAFT_763156 [Rhodocollybia butyracea]